MANRLQQVQAQAKARTVMAPKLHPCSNQQLPTHQSPLQDTLLATMKAGFDQLASILREEKAPKGRKRPTTSDSDEMSHSEELAPCKATCSRIHGDDLSDLCSVSDFEGDVNSLIQQLQTKWRDQSLPMTS